MEDLVKLSKMQEDLDNDLFSLLERVHGSGLPYHEILKSYLNILQALILKVDAEVWLNRK